MGFGLPHYLIGLITLPIPLLIHLWAKYRLKRIWFPSIMLVIESRKGESRFRRIREILLLIIRTAILLFLVLSFASPYIWVKRKIIILDDSWDMSMKYKNSSLFTEAQNIASSIPGGKIFLASGTEEFCPKYEKFYLPTQGVDYVITRKGKLPPSPKVIEVGEDTFTNLSIDSIYIRKAHLTAIINNHSNRWITQTVRLVCQDTFSLGSVFSPLSRSTLTFPLPRSAGYLQLEEDCLPLDNKYYFSYTSSPFLSVFIFSPFGGDFFLKNALSPTKERGNIKVKVGRKYPSLPTYDCIFFLTKKCSPSPNSIFFPSHPTFLSSPLRITWFYDGHPIFTDLKKHLSQWKVLTFNYFYKIPPHLIKTVLAKFSNNSPAIVEGNNNTILFGFPVDERAKQFILSPLFPIFIQKVACWVGRKFVSKKECKVGEEIRAKVKEYKSYTCRKGKEVFSFFPIVEEDGFYLSFYPSSPGIYQIEGVGNFAVNISNQLVKKEISLPKEGKLKVSVKKWVLFFVFFLMLLELVLRSPFNRIKRG